MLGSIDGHPDVADGGRGGPRCFDRGRLSASIYLLVEESMPVQPSWIGKWSTTFQLLTLAVALVTLHDPVSYCIRLSCRSLSR